MNTIPPRLRWACRRGMLELDVLLNKFLEGAYLQLTNTDQATFMALLECSDQDLFLWLTGQSKPSEPVLAQMVDQIISYARQSNR